MTFSCLYLKKHISAARTNPSSAPRLPAPPCCASQTRIPFSQRRDPGKPEDDGGDDSDPMSEDDDDDDSEDGDDLNGNGTKVAGVSLAAAQAAAGEAAKSGTSSHKFMPPIEVELQMQQLWKHEASTLDLIFVSGEKRRRPEAENGLNGGGHGAGDAADAAAASGGVYDGYRVFFIRALAVPPPRFRPPMNMGDMVAEHPQNVYLIKVGGRASMVLCVVIVASRRGVIVLTETFLCLEMQRFGVQL